MKALTYIEIDVPEFSDTDAGEKFVAPDLEYDFEENSVFGWTGSEATLTATSSGATFVPTADDPVFRSPAGLTIDGSTQRYIAIDVERTAVRTIGVWQGSIFYITAGHPEDGGHTNSFPELENTIGARETFVIDMHDLDAGGTDWADSVITRFRIDFEDGQTGTVTPDGAFKIHSVTVGERMETYRFAYDSDYLPTDIDAIPSLTAVAYTPAIISLGKDLGTRASLTCAFMDHRHIFDGEPFEQGTFFGKFRARHGMTLQGRSIRWIQGLEGQDLDDMETRHFIIESTDGPTPKGAYAITAKDVLKLADGDRAQAPMPSNGFMVGSLTNVGASLTLSPSGIGNAEYATSGYLALGGEECVSFTRSGDVVTLTGRGQLGTVAAAHDAGSRVQTILRYVGESPATIIYDLLVNYAGVDPDYIPLASWENEVDAFLQQNYSANIADPTDVNKLISEIIEQAALVVWWEPLTQLIRLQVLRAISTTAAVFSEENTMEGSLTIKEQPNTRISQVLTYFGQRDPLAPIDEERNFRSSVLTVDGDAEIAYRTGALRKVYSRWIPFGARTVALRLNDILLGRFRDPPRRFTLNLFRYGTENPTLGGGYRLTSWAIQDITGLPDNAPLQITRLNPLSDRFEIEAEEMLFETQDPGDLVNRVIIIDAAINNVNLRDLHDSIYPDPDAGASPAESLRVIIEANVIVGSNGPTLRAFDVGSWPVGYPISIEVYGGIRGAGGDGGSGLEFGSRSGQDGGTALYTRFPIDVEIFEGGSIWGGGGGGAGDFKEDDDGDQIGYGGGGGAGILAGDGGPGVSQGGEAGTETQGGAGGGAFIVVAGDGGDPGEPATQPPFIPGDPPAQGPGDGDAGRAIDGISFVTLTDTSPTSVRGPEVN